jgi:hypothetical protein
MWKLSIVVSPVGSGGKFDGGVPESRAGTSHAADAETGLIGDDAENRDQYSATAAGECLDPRGDIRARGG